MQAGSASNDFVAKISQALEGAWRRGIHVTAGACDLEAQQFDRRPEEEEALPSGRPHHLESPVGSRDLGGHEGASRLCYFLDGVQSSREIGRIGMSPVIVSAVAAAIVNRCGKRFSRMPLESPPVVVQAVILPRSAGDAGVEAFWDLLLAAGFSELDPDEVPSSPHLVLDSAEYIVEADPSDYVGMRETARVRVRSLRERLEAGLLRRWEGDDRVLEDSEAWIAVDGQLRREKGERRTSWYLRMWPPQRGADALGSLMRVEAPRDTEPEQVDEISRWILAERAPLAKPDPRWPAMIYPMQYVEKILKPLVQGSERAYARLERQLASNGRN